MSTIDLQLDCPLHDSFRVRQIAGMFDLPIEEKLTQRFSAEVPAVCEPWEIGVIVGPSGSGKSSIARAAFGNALFASNHWPEDRAVIDCFGEVSIQQITHILSAVGLSSPPAWVKPYWVLSNGEKFRCDLARALVSAEPVLPGTEGALTAVAASKAGGNLVVFDEFTSVVDRTAARIGSAAVAGAIRRKKIDRRFVAVTCHYDVVPWLEPDWVLDMASQTLSRRRLRRPDIRLVVRPAERSAWNLFRRHHYLSGEIHSAARCFVGWIDDRPATFAAVLPFPHPRRSGWREHRMVCLPDYQGVGIGSRFGAFVAGLFVATGKPYFSTSGHPAMIRHRAASRDWRMCRRPGVVSRSGKGGAGKTGMRQTLSRTRLTAGFEYIGPPRRADALALGVAC